MLVNRPALYHLSYGKCNRALLCGVCLFTLLPIPCNAANITLRKALWYALLDVKFIHPPLVALDIIEIVQVRFGGQRTLVEGTRSPCPSMAFHSFPCPTMRCSHVSKSLQTELEVESIVTS